MKTKLLLLLPLIAYIMVTGCKNDDEEDYLTYLEQQKAQIPDTKPSDPKDPIATSDIVLNELDGNAKFIEIYNCASQPIEITGWKIEKDESKIVYVAPKSTIIPAHGFLMLNGNATDFTQGFTSGLSADKATKIALMDAQGKLKDVFINPPEDETGTWQSPGTYSAKEGQKSFSRYPDGHGDWNLSESTPAMKNLQGIKL